MPHSYENYELKSQFFAELRKPVGIEKQLQYFSKNRTPLNEQVLLDGGCGTGNYAKVFANKFKEVHCFDYSKGMLEKAKENMKKTHGNVPANVHFHSGNIAHLRCFHDNMFDSICVNQVLHHLRPDNDFDDLRKTMKEFHRVLKPGGRLVVNFCPFKNRRQAIFWGDLIPNAADQWMSRAFTQKHLEESAAGAGFSQISCEPLYEENMFVENIYHPRHFIENLHAVLSSDSVFAMALPEEIDEAVGRVKKMRDENTLDQWFENKEKERKSMGQTLNFYCVKK